MAIKYFFNTNYRLIKDSPISFKLEAKTGFNGIFNLILCFLLRLILDYI